MHPTLIKQLNCLNATEHRDLFKVALFLHVGAHPIPSPGVLLSFEPQLASVWASLSIHWLLSNVQHIFNLSISGQVVFCTI